MWASLGSLIQMREGVGQLLDDWVDTRAKETGLTKLIGRNSDPQLELGSILTEADRSKALQLELERKILEKEAVAPAAETASLHRGRSGRGLQRIPRRGFLPRIRHAGSNYSRCSPAITTLQ